MYIHTLLVSIHIYIYIYIFQYGYTSISHGNPSNPKYSHDTIPYIYIVNGKDDIPDMRWKIQNV